jgi:hypothetical protein
LVAIGVPVMGRESAREAWIGVRCQPHGRGRDEAGRLLASMRRRALTSPIGGLKPLLGSDVLVSSLGVW